MSDKRDEFYEDWINLVENACESLEDISYRASEIAHELKKLNAFLAVDDSIDDDNHESCCHVTRSF